MIFSHDHGGTERFHSFIGVYQILWSSGNYFDMREPLEISKRNITILPTWCQSPIFTARDFVLPPPKGGFRKPK